MSLALSQRSLPLGWPCGAMMKVTGAHPHAKLRCSQSGVSRSWSLLQLADQVHSVWSTTKWIYIRCVCVVYLRSFLYSANYCNSRVESGRVFSRSVLTGAKEEPTGRASFTSIWYFEALRAQGCSLYPRDWASFWIISFELLMVFITPKLSV